MERNVMVKRYNQELKRALGELEARIKRLQGDVITKKYFGIEKLDPVAQVALELLTGKLGIVNDVAAQTKLIIKLMKNSGLNPDDLYRESSRILRERIRKTRELAEKQRKSAKTKKNKRTREETLIRAFFSEMLKEIIDQELLQPLRYDIYPSLRKDSVRTTCGAECIDGHPCQHIVWEGWLCWQHGGTAVGTA